MGGWVGGGGGGGGGQAAAAGATVCGAEQAAVEPEPELVRPLDRPSGRARVAAPLSRLLVAEPELGERDAEGVLLAPLLLRGG